MDEFSTKIKEYIMTEVNPDLHLDHIDDDELLIESGIIDSLGVLRILAYLDEAFGIDLSADGINLENFKTIRTICKLIEQQQAS
jgi:acyl carrier protein